MKKCATQCFFFILITTALSAQISFQRNFGEPSKFDEIAAVSQTADGQYLVAGSTANYGAVGYDMLFEKIDNSGATLWRQTWGNTGNDRVKDMIQVSSGGFLVCGHTGEVLTDNDLVVLRLDEEGNESWRLTRGGPYDDQALFAVELSDGGFIIAGHIVLQESNAQDIFLMRINSQGGVVWEKNVPDPGVEVLKGLAPAEDGGFFVAEGLNSLIKFDDQGNEIWVQLILTQDDVPLETGHLEKTNDGQLRISGRNLGSSKPFWAELDEDGNVSSIFDFEEYSEAASAEFFTLTSDGKIWVLTKIFSSFSTISPFLSLYDPSTGEITLSLSITELGLPDLLGNPDTPVKVYAAGAGGFLLAGTTYSDLRGNNGLLLLADAGGQESWRKVIGVEAISDNESARMVIQTDDGGYLLAGTNYTPANGRDLWLLRTDAGGTVQWTSQLGDQGNESVTGLTEMSDGSFVVTGFRQDTLLVSRVGDDGVPLWYREFDIQLSDGTFGVAVTPDDEILVTLPVSDVSSSAGLLMKINAQGDSLWTQTYQPAPGGFNATYGVIPATGGYYLCGCAEAPDGSFAPLLLKTDEDGNQIWANIYEPIGFFSCLITIRQGSDADLYANGIGIANGTHPYVLKASSEGTLERSDTVATANGTSYFSWFSDLQEGTGFQALFGRKTISNTLQGGIFNAGTITLLDQEGNVSWERDFGQEMNGGFLGGVATADGGFAAVGSARFDNSRDAWLVKTEPDGTVGFTMLLAAPFEAGVFPNPAGEWLQVSMAGLFEGAVTLSVFNLNGQRLFTDYRQVVGGTLEHSLAVGALPAGIYLLHLRQGSKSRTLKWTKK